jgi:VRR-NUC domain-containing protein
MAIMFARQGKRKSTPESAFRLECIHWLRKRFAGRIWEYRTVGGLGQRSGIPDDFFVIRNGADGPGVFVAIEFKAPNGRWKLTELQAAEIDAIKRAGGTAGKVGSMEELEELVKGIEPVQRSLWG